MDSVSIIIPIYNVENYIENCIRSVMQQSFSGELECILVDDCGSDNSMEIVKKITNSYTGQIKFQILCHSQNRGLSAARNTGINKATGDYLFFLDSDDSITPNCIELLVKKSEEYPQAQIIQGGVITDRGGSIIDMESNSSKVVDFWDDPIAIKKSILLNNSYYKISAWNKLIKRNFIIEHNLFFKEGIIYEDAHWHYFVAKYLLAVAFVHKNTYIYSIRDNSIMRSNTYFSAKSQESWTTLATDYYNHLDSICFREQISRIMDVAFPLYIHSKNIEYIKNSKEIIVNTAKKCSFCKKIRILFVLSISRYLMKRARIYRFFIFKFI